VANSDLPKDGTEKGWTGELRTRQAQSLFLDPNQYCAFNDLIIYVDGRSTQIDHVLVSKYGLFVIETKNMTGWIFGTVDDERWTQVIYGTYYQFQNPLRQNYMHTKSLSHFLRIEHNKIYSLVVFWGKCQFRTLMPENVLSNQFTTYVKSKKDVLLSEDEVYRVRRELQRLKDNTPFVVALSHAQSLKRRYESNTICPKCGGHLLKRTSYKTRLKFIGCENYPGCHYVKYSNLQSVVL